MYFLDSENTSTFERYARTAEDISMYSSSSMGSSLDNLDDAFTMSKFTSNEETDIYNSSYIDQNSKPVESRPVDLILPDVPEDIIPFASHTFNRRPGKDSNSFVESGTSSLSSFSQLSSASNQINELQSYYATPIKPVINSHNDQTDHVTKTLSLRTDSNESIPNMTDDFLLSKSVEYPENFLVDLGFGFGENLLPERFARDWYNKVSGLQTKERARQDSHDSHSSENNLVLPHLSERSNAYKLFDDVDSSFIPAKQEPSKNTNVSDLDNLNSVNIESLALQKTGSSSHHINQLPNQLVKKGVVDCEKDKKTDFAYQPNNYQLPYKFSLNNKQPSTKNMRRKQFAKYRCKSLPLSVGTLPEESKNSSLGYVDDVNDNSSIHCYVKENKGKNGFLSDVLHKPVVDQVVDATINQEHLFTLGRDSVSDTLPSESGITDLSSILDKQLMCENQKLFDNEDRHHISLDNCVESFHENSERRNYNLHDQMEARSVQNQTDIIPFPTFSFKPSISKSTEVISHGSESLEVAEILVEATEREQKNNEYGAISIVFDSANDTDDGQSRVCASDYQKKHLKMLGSHQAYLSPSLNNHLAVSRRSSTASSAMLSPVTVIEKKLDNQNDTFEYEDDTDNVNLSHEFHSKNRKDLITSQNSCSESEEEWNKTDEKSNLGFISMNLDSVRHSSPSFFINRDVPMSSKKHFNSSECNVCTQVEMDMLPPIICFNELDIIDRNSDPDFCYVKDVAVQWEEQQCSSSINIRSSDICSNESPSYAKTSDQIERDSNNSMCQHLSICMQDGKIISSQLDKINPSQHFSLPYSRPVLCVDNSIQTDQSCPYVCDFPCECVDICCPEHSRTAQQNTLLEQTIERLSRKTRKMEKDFKR